MRSAQWLMLNSRRSASDGNATVGAKERDPGMSKLKMMYAQSAVPLYIQIASALRHRIETGYWQPRQKISTLEELEREFEVARVTVRLAIELLEGEGLVNRQQGRGTFVADTVQTKHWLRLETSWESLISPIKGNVPKIIKVDNPPRTPTLAEEDGTLANEYVFLRSLQLKGDTPYAIVSLHLAREIYDSDPDAFAVCVRNASGSKSTTATPMRSSRTRRFRCSPHAMTSASSAPTRRWSSALRAPRRPACCRFRWARRRPSATA